MDIQFPKSCKLNDAEKNMLRMVLDSTDFPCDECSHNDTCDGPQEHVSGQLDAVERFGEVCPLDLAELASKTYCRMLGGTFSKCPNGDWMFSLFSAPEPGL